MKLKWCFISAVLLQSSIGFCDFPELGVYNYLLTPVSRLLVPFDLDREQRILDVALVEELELLLPESSNITFIIETIKRTETENTNHLRIVYRNDTGFSSDLTIKQGQLKMSVTQNIDNTKKVVDIKVVTPEVDSTIVSKHCTIHQKCPLSGRITIQIPEGLVQWREKEIQWREKENQSGVKRRLQISSPSDHEQKRVRYDDSSVDTDSSDESSGSSSSDDSDDSSLNDSSTDSSEDEENSNSDESSCYMMIGSIGNKRGKVFKTKDDFEKFLSESSRRSKKRK